MIFCILKTQAYNSVREITMAKPKMRMHLSGMPLTDDKVDKVLKLSGVEDSTATNLEDQLYMNDYSVFETEILHLKHSGKWLYCKYGSIN